MHSHHSHSGDYVAHGVDPLEQIISQAQKMNFHTYCLTEHMPRLDSVYLYPEELEIEEGEEGEEGKCSDIKKTKALQKLQDNFRAFLDHASRVKSRLEADPSNATRIIIGMEIEGCDTRHIRYARELLQDYRGLLMYGVGSVHYIHGIPIDFNREYWYDALKAVGNNFKNFLISYFDLQYELLTTVKPLVVGHFDLYKLFLPNDLKVDRTTGEVKSAGGDLVTINEVGAYIYIWDDVKERVIRNLKLIRSYGGVIEINTAGLRKGLSEPYPGIDICTLVKEYCGGRFVLSDEAHSVNQVGTCYKQTLKYITETLQLDRMFYLEEERSDKSRFPDLVVKSLAINEFVDNIFWKGL